MSFPAAADLKGGIKTPYEVEQREIVPVFWNLATSSQVRFPIHLTFLPDTMTVRTIHYCDLGAAGAAQPAISLVASDIVGGVSILGSFSNSNGGAQYCGSEFRITRPISGSYLFSVQTITGAPDAARTQPICIMLEFYKAPGKPRDLP